MSNDPAIPQEWITGKTIKTISGAALCCWLITLFFDVVLFSYLFNDRIRPISVLIVSILSAVLLAMNKVFTLRGRKKMLWMLVLPNAMLVYIHALGFQVASKELATRAYLANTTNRHVEKAGIGNFLGFLTKQTSWIPSFELTNKLEETERRYTALKRANNSRKDSIISTPVIIEKPIENVFDSVSYYHRLYKQTGALNASLNKRMDSLNSRLTASLEAYQMCIDAGKKGDSLLIRRIDEKNALINKWNAILSGMQFQKTDIERIINGYMGDESFYRKLFKPMPKNKQ